ncbi:hypothetical protein PR048_017107 [Dryococelus australis]|uniref:Uncharacterized protein n=1 Tax=Dryococelus australis TaxID=614101 RepID=A0ABQ9H8K2_9NEOP|nr:hypothetical protein PR048_017107 [Dryococelus australis]
MAVLATGRPACDEAAPIANSDVSVSTVNGTSSFNGVLNGAAMPFFNGSKVETSPGDKRKVLDSTKGCNEVRVEQHPNARAGEVRYPRENPLTSGIVRHDSHLRKSCSVPAGDRTRNADNCKTYILEVKRFGWLLTASSRESMRVIEVNRLWSGAGMKGRGKREIPEKTRRPTVSSGMIHTCENPVTRLGIEPVPSSGDDGRATPRDPRRLPVYLTTMMGNRELTGGKDVRVHNRLYDASSMNNTNIPKIGSIAHICRYTSDKTQSDEGSGLVELLAPLSYETDAAFGTAQPFGQHAVAMQQVIHAVRREHCTPVQRLALSVDGALEARDKVALIISALLGFRRGKKLQCKPDVGTGANCVSGRTLYAHKERKSCKETCIATEREWVAVASDWGHDYLSDCPRRGSRARDVPQPGIAHVCWKNAGERGKDLTELSAHPALRHLSGKKKGGTLAITESTWRLEGHVHQAAGQEQRQSPARGLRSAHILRWMTSKQNGCIAICFTLWPLLLQREYSSSTVFEPPHHYLPWSYSDIAVRLPVIHQGEVSGGIPPRTPVSLALALNLYFIPTNERAVAVATFRTLIRDDLGSIPGPAIPISVFNVRRTHSKRMLG